MADGNLSQSASLECHLLPSSMVLHRNQFPALQAILLRDLGWYWEPVLQQGFQGTLMPRCLLRPRPGTWEVLDFRTGFTVFPAARGCRLLTATAAGPRGQGGGPGSPGDRCCCWGRTGHGLTNCCWNQEAVGPAQVPPRCGPCCPHVAPTE